MTSNTAIVTLYGNVGKDPETQTIPGKTVKRKLYDPIIDDLVEKEFTTPDREVRSFWIAVSAKNDEETQVTRWIRCVDWEGLSRLVRKGDRLRVRGPFQHRRYQKDGETKSLPEIIVKDLRIERPKVREQVA